MSFILRNHHDRYRQRARESFVRNAVVCGIVVVAIMAGYVVGQQRQKLALSQAKIVLRETLDRASQSEMAMTSLRSKNETLNIELQQLKATYQTQIPQGDLLSLTSLLQEQLDKGMNVDRLRQIIKAARPPQNCSAPLSKRFILSTPAYEGPESKITFAEGAITVIGHGEASINSTGNKEAWFDAGKKVKVTFAQPGGIQEIKEGILPIHHTIIRNDKEYRFSVSEGPRSFVVVTSDSCDYLEADRGHYQPNVKATTTTLTPPPPPVSPSKAKAKISFDAAEPAEVTEPALEEPATEAPAEPVSQ